VDDILNPANWLYIGALTTVMLAQAALIVTLTNRSMTAAISGLRGELHGEIALLDGKIAGLDGKIAGLDAKIDARFESLDHRLTTMDKRMDRLDQDVAALVKKAMD
jgi:hypothetical protein